MKLLKLRRSVVLTLILAAWSFSAVAAKVPVGSHVTVRLGKSLSSATATAGESWHGTLTHDLVANGKTVARAGDPVGEKLLT